MEKLLSNNFRVMIENVEFFIISRGKRFSGNKIAVHQQALTV